MANVWYSKKIDPRNSPHMVELKKGDNIIPPLLFELFRRATPYGTEHHIINLLPFKDKGNVDKKGNFFIEVGENPTVMFSSHMDTVHTLPKNMLDVKACGLIKLVTLKDPDDATKNGYLYGAAKMTDKDETKTWYEGRVLGGDDKIGVYTMCRMIEAGIKGLYVFHVGEECGAHGSKFISTENKQLVKNITHCIAFDRKDYTDVIAFQRNERTASKKCTDEIAARLNTIIKPQSKEYTFKGEVHGLFTDSASYKDIIHECTNISIGYNGAHSADESFDFTWYFSSFLPAVLEMDWQTLPVDRDCKEVKKVTIYDNVDDYGYGGYYGNHGTNNRLVTVNGTPLNTVKVAFDKITKHTPMYALPAWKPDDGFAEGASLEGMEKLIEKWLTDNYNTRAKLLVPTFLHIAEIETENLALQMEIDDLNAEYIDSKSVVSKLSPEKFQENLKFKLHSIHKMLDLLDIKGMTQEERNLFVAEGRVFRKIARRLRKKMASCTYEDYIMINKCMVTIMGCMPEDPTNASLAILMKNCLRHIVDNIDEEGYEEIADTKDDLLKVVEKMETGGPVEAVA